MTEHICDAGHFDRSILPGALRNDALLLQHLRPNDGLLVSHRSIRARQPLGLMRPALAEEDKPLDPLAQAGRGVFCCVLGRNVYT